MTIDQDIAWGLWTRGLSRSAAAVEMIFRGEKDLAMPVLDMVSIIA